MEDTKYVIPEMPLEGETEFYESVADLKIDNASSGNEDVFNPNRYRELIFAMEKRSEKAREDIEDAKQILLEKIGNYEKLQQEFYDILTKGGILYKSIANELSLYKTLYEKFDKVSEVHKDEK